MDATKECRRRIVYTKAKKYSIISAVILYCIVGSIQAAIRYGFLAASFTKRNISGKVYGMVEGIVFIGYIICFTCGCAPWALKRFTAKVNFTVIMLIQCLLTISTGVAFYIEDNTAMVIASMVIRLVQGFVNYIQSISSPVFMNHNFPDQFDFLNGLINAGYCSGHSIAEAVGCLIYDHYGYIPPFFFSGVMCFICLFIMLALIPNEITYTHPSTKEEDGSKSTGLTKMIIIPTIATLLVNAICGFLQVTVTPYLNTVFGKSLSYGGLVLTLVSVGMGLGGVASGVFLQNKLISVYTQMAFGALMIALGLLIIFPPQFLGLFYRYAPILAFPGVLISGFGDPFMIVASLRALFQLQMQYKGQLTSKQSLQITGIWVVGYDAGYSSGSLVAGILADVMSYTQAAGVLIGCCVVSVVLCLGMKMVVMRRKVCSEEELLIGSHDDVQDT